MLLAFHCYYDDFLFICFLLLFTKITKLTICCRSMSVIIYWKVRYVSD